MKHEAANSDDGVYKLREEEVPSSNFFRFIINIYTRIATWPEGVEAEVVDDEWAIREKVCSSENNSFLCKHI